MDSREAISPLVFDGPPPEGITVLPTGDVRWICECGASGISSNTAWAISDVNRHRRNTWLTIKTVTL